MSRFSPSVNLIRDAGRELHYIPTANARRIYDQILADYKVGVHAFSIIGSYGTGKSAFLLAFEKTLAGTHHYFPAHNGQLGTVHATEFINIVGSYTSIIDAFRQHPSVVSEGDQIFDRLAQTYDEIHESGRRLAIVIDEFGKFLEFAAHFNPEEELYFIQRLAEFVNDPCRDMMLITVLHQNFSTYGAGLNRDQREEWEKVKGRLKELTFNEPIEQLLELVASLPNSDSVVDFKHLRNHPPPANDELTALVEAIDLSAAFPHRPRLSTAFAGKLLPLDILSASVLTQALQRYGQNERSLFTFLYANDYLGINAYSAGEHPFYNLACVYDYLAHNYESLLNSVYNPHYAQWGLIRRAQERAEVELSEDVVSPAVKLLKVVGLLSIFSPDGTKINRSFLSEYGRLALGLENVKQVLDDLESRKIIRYIRFKDAFVLFEGTDLEIEFALAEAESHVDSIGNLALHLQEHYSFPLLLAKSFSFRTGTPRFFSFCLSEEPIADQPDGLTDGIVNLVFSNDVNLEHLRQGKSPQYPTTLYGVYRNTGQIRHALQEIRKIDYVVSVNQDDRVAVRELQRLRVEAIDKLNRQMLDSFYDNSALVWVWAGQTFEIRDARILNSVLSHICDSVYQKTPCFQNELVNRHRVSPAVSTARRGFFRALVANWQQPDLGFPPTRYPAEKGIYLTLLKETGIHRPADESHAPLYVLDEPTDDSFLTLWNACEEFLNGAKTIPRNLNQLVEMLSRPPFKLKEGFISFWIPTFIFAKREEFALYHNGVYLPTLASDALDLMQKEPESFRIKSFAVDGVRLSFFNRFQRFVQQAPSERISNTGFIETIRPFLTFYRSLSPYAQRTSQLDARTIRLREAIARASDPEKTFFEDFPHALGFDDIAQSDIDAELEEFVDRLQSAIRELRICYDDLVDRVEKFLIDLLGLGDAQFPDYREEIKERYRTLRLNEVLPNQRVLLMRLTSALDDRDAWLNSVVQAVLGRDIRRMVDGDEETVYSKLRISLAEMDTLCQIDELNANLEQELPPVAFEITTTDTGSRRRLHRISRRKEPAISDLEGKLRAHLTEDEAVNIGALLRLLKGMISDD